MSTILRALKKLEQDKETLGTKGMPGKSATTDSKTNVRTGRFTFSKRVLVTTIICVAFLGISAAAGYFFMQSRQSASQSRRSAKTSQAADQQTKTDTSRQTPKRFKANTRQSIPETPASNRQPGGKMPAETSDTPTQRPSAHHLSSAKVQTQRQVDSKPDLGMFEASGDASPNVASKPPLLPDKTGKSGAAASDSVPRKRKPKPAGTKKTDNETYPTADRLWDNRLKIQAIAWSPVSEERMAVINSRIVREGSSVEGFSVVAIRPDDVIVKEQGRLYRVVFGQP
jgi:cytoskeletal protein RodZ